VRAHVAAAPHIDACTWRPHPQASKRAHDNTAAAAVTITISAATKRRAG